MRLGFIFSLPRAGSTYVQRVLSGADGVKTVPEPWLMPALLGIRYGEAPLADFAYDHVRIALNDILAKLDDGEKAWRMAVSDMATSLYSNFANENELFIDKTPRNAVFCNEILKTFPDAKILFLWRNPLAVVASINATWGKEHWKSYFYEYDLYKGLDAMLSTYENHMSDSRVMAVQYENLVGGSDENWTEVFNHFGLDFTPDAVVKPPKMISNMGDQTGQSRYSGTSASSINNWQNSFGNGLRRRWANKYLNHIGAQRLKIMGYDIDELKDGINKEGISKLSDYALIPLSPVYHWLEPFILKSKRSRKSRFFARR